MRGNVLTLQGFYSFKGANSGNEANDRRKYMCFMISGDRIEFDSRRCNITFPIKSVQTIYSSKGDVSCLYEGKTRELSRERERESKTLVGPF